MKKSLRKCVSALLLERTCLMWQTEIQLWICKIRFVLLGTNTGWVGAVSIWADDFNFVPGKKAYLMETDSGKRREISLSFPGDQPGDHILPTFTECWEYLASGYVTYKFAAYLFSPMTSIWVILYLDLELSNGLRRLSILNYSSILEEWVLSADPIITEKPMESIHVEK